MAAVDVPASVPELAPVAASKKPNAFAQAFPSPTPVAQDSQRFVREAVADSRPTRRIASAQPSDAVANGSHLVQLGSFSSEAGAKRAWSIYTKRYPDLANHEMVISEAVVNGKHYWRVSAAGYDANGSKAMCGRVKGSGHGCFAYHESRPLPGAVDTGVRLASR